MQNFIKAMNSAYKRGNSVFEPAIKHVCEKAMIYEEVNRIGPLKSREQDDFVK